MKKWSQKDVRRDFKRRASINWNQNIQKMSEGNFILCYVPEKRCRTIEKRMTCSVN